MQLQSMHRHDGVQGENDGSESDAEDTEAEARRSLARATADIIACGSRRSLGEMRAEAL